MTKLFLDIFNLSISASWIVGVVLLLRFIIGKRIPKWTVCLLWGIVGLRLLIPFYPQSQISLMPSTETVKTQAVLETEEVEPPVENKIPDSNPNNAVSNHTPDFSGNTNQKPQNTVIPNTRPNTIKPETKPETKPEEYINIGINAIDKPINQAIAENTTENTKKPFEIAKIASIVWVCGMAVMVIYAVVNYIVLRKRVSEFVPEGNIRRCRKVGSPFILGVFRPRIYMPYGLSPQHEEMIIAHERAHLKRGDHFIKPFGFALLSVYWFNPFIWIAYILLCRDIEVACDEKVVKNLNADMRKVYAGALLECGIKRSVIAACPVAFGEIGVKTRVKNALNYKKPLFWVIICGIVICAVVAILFLTSPNEKEDESSNSSQTSSDVSSETSNDDSSETNSDDSSDTSSNGDDKIIYSGEMTIERDKKFNVPQEKADIIYQILNNGEWTNEAPEIVPNYLFQLGSLQLQYASGDVGCFVDIVNNRCLMLAGKEIAAIDNIIIGLEEPIIPNDPDQDLVQVYTSSGDADMYLTLTADEQELIYNILVSDRWENGTADCECNYMFVLSDSNIGYHSSCGTFNDFANSLHLKLTDEEKEKLNEILKTAMDEFADRNQPKSIGYTEYTFHSGHSGWGDPSFGDSYTSTATNLISSFDDFSKIDYGFDGLEEFKNSLSADFFDNFSIISAMALTPCLDRELSVESVTVYGNILEMVCQYDNSTPGDMMVECVLYLAVVKNADIADCTIFTSYQQDQEGNAIFPNEPGPEFKPIEFEGYAFNNVIISASDEGIEKVNIVISSVNQLKNFQNNYVNEDFNTLCQTFDESFFEKNTLIASVVSTPNIGLTLSVTEVGIYDDIELMMYCEYAYIENKPYADASENVLFVAVVNNKDITNCAYFSTQVSKGEDIPN